jgi:type II pantothenate kinase
VRLLIIGIDIGGSTTKGIILEDSRIVHKCFVQTSDINTSASNTLETLFAKIGDKSVIDLIAVSGGGSRKIGNKLLGLPIEKVDEIRAIGLGGLILAKKRKGLIVSVGTGTAIVAACDGGKSVKHIGGTGVGGGTILGLSKRIIGVDDFATLEDMASNGDACKVDLTVADIVGGSIGIIPGEATASNFGRLVNTGTKDDVAAGIFNMVSQVVGVIGVMAAKAHNLEEDVVFVGRPVRSRIVSKIIRETADLFGVKVCIPENCEFCMAVGAAGHILSEKLPRPPLE